MLHLSGNTTTIWRIISKRQGPIKENGRENLRKVSISRIKKEMNDVFYLSDDLVITTLSAQNNTTAEYPASIDGFRPSS